MFLENIKAQNNDLKLIQLGHIRSWRNPLAKNIDFEAS